MDYLRMKGSIFFISFLLSIYTNNCFAYIQNPQVLDKSVTEHKGLLQAKSLYNKNQIKEALTLWDGIATAEKERPLVKIAALINLASHYRINNLHSDSILKLESAQQLALGINDYNLYGYICGLLASEQLASNKYEEAEWNLLSGIEHLKQTDNHHLLSLLKNDLGRIKYHNHDYNEAKKLYLSAMNESLIVGETNLSSLFNLVDLPLALEKQELDVISAESIKILMSGDDNRLLDNTQRILSLLLNGYKNTQNMYYITKFFEIYSAVKSKLEEIVDKTLDTDEIEENIAEAHYFLGEYHESEEILNRIIFSAEKDDDHYNLIERYWLLARNQQSLNDISGSIKSYQHSIAHHQDLYLTSNANFSLGSANKLYQEYAELLLVQYDESGDSSILRNVILTIETLRTARVQDYFKNQCVAKAKSTTKNIFAKQFKKVSFLYTLSIGERYEIFLVQGEKIFRSISSYSASEIATLSKQYRILLENSDIDTIQKYSKLLYDALILPIEPYLNHSKVLVIIPDEYIAKFPFASLYDGKNYLIDRIALAMSPAIHLTDTSTTEQKSRSALYTGLTLPVFGLPALINVRQELSRSAQEIPGKILLNHNFATKSMKTYIDQGSYDILHIASHAKVDTTVDNSFIYTGNDKLTLDSLQEMVGSTRYSANPIDLLTLSACSTAVTEDNASLGFAGLAVKSGAHSVLASLWEVRDITTAELIVYFYQHLSENLSKAESLRQAQLKIKSNSRYAHPSNWAAFILIGNWW